MKASEVYLRAAKLVNRFDSNVEDGWDGRGYPSCVAVSDSGGYFDERDVYCALFKTPHCSSHSTWGLKWGETNAEVKQCRVLALLFMHEIAKDEEGRKS